jgi:hypothetical protein
MNENIAKYHPLTGCSQTKSAVLPRDLVQSRIDPELHASLWKPDARKRERGGDIRFSREDQRAITAMLFWQCRVPTKDWFRPCLLSRQTNSLAVGNLEQLSCTRSGPQQPCRADGNS